MGARRIVVTGGPGGGKTTLWRALCARFADALVPVPEVATLLLGHVFPPVQNAEERRAVQRSIFRVQRDLERVHGVRAGEDRWVLLDRGSPDGGAYWPDGHAEFFAAMGTEHVRELARYDAVLFLETAAAGGHSITEGNPTRMEDLDEARAIDARLRAVWGTHPRFHLVPQQPTLEAKVTLGVAVVETWLRE